jgi:hypothetical protein
MKYLGFLLALFTASLLGCSDAAQAPKPGVLKVQQATEGYLRAGTRYERRSCRSCTCGSGNCKIGIAGQDEPQVDIAVHDGRLDMIFATYYDPAEGELLTLSAEDEYFVDAEVAEQLGYHSIKVLRGEYPIDFERGPYGAVTFNVAVE